MEQAAPRTIRLQGRQFASDSRSGATSPGARLPRERLNREALRSQRRQKLGLFGIAVVVEQSFQAVDRIEEDESSIAAALAGPPPHAVRQAHQRLNGGAFAGDALTARFDLGLDEIEE